MHVTRNTLMVPLLVLTQPLPVCQSLRECSSQICVVCIAENHTDSFFMYISIDIWNKINNENKRINYWIIMRNATPEMILGPILHKQF